MHMSRPIEGTIMKHDPIAVARASYRAYVDKDRAAIEALIADDFHFTSPLDSRIDRATYFARCWPNSTTLAGFDFTRGLNRDFATAASCRPTSILLSINSYARRPRPTNDAGPAEPISGRCILDRGSCGFEWLQALGA
jgi:hypothetical protein